MGTTTSRAGTGAQARRAKGTGCLVNRNGIWYARWTHRGKVHFASTHIRVGEKRKTEDGKTVSDKKLAEEFLLDKTEYIRVRHQEDAIAMLIRQMQSKTERIRTDIERTRHRPTLGELGGIFEKSARRPDCGEDMMDFYKCKIREFAAFAGDDTEVENVDERTTGAYASQLRNSTRAGTFNKAINALKLVWTACAPELGLMPDENPWAGIKRRKADAHTRRCFTEEETDRILATATGEIRTLFAVGLYTGMRLGDCARLRWEDFKENGVYVTTAKTGAKVAIPVHPKFEKILGKRKKSGYVTPAIAEIYNDEKRRSHVTRLTSRTLKKCGIETSLQEKGKRALPDAGFHSLRHTFVSNAIAAGVPPHIVQAIVGHTKLAMTEHYEHMDNKAVLEAFGKMR